MQTANKSLIISNANEIVTLRSKGSTSPLRMSDQELILINNGSLIIQDGKITDILDYPVSNSNSPISEPFTFLDATKKTVIPGLVDSHTHVSFAGNREDELEMKLQGLTYLEILKQGGGIMRTVNATRKASLEELVKRGKENADIMLKHGTTTIEAKSGYGLDKENEIKQLKALRKLNQNCFSSVISTYLGAHALPPEYSNQREKYIDLIIQEVIPEISKNHLARFIDVFCEKGVYSIEESREILLAGKRGGLRPKIHADEIVQTGGAQLAAEVGAISADHLLMTDDDGFRALADAGVIPVLLPGTPFSLMKNEYPLARRMIDEFDLPVALATDLNPNCFCHSMLQIITLACFNMQMLPMEALLAATSNSAAAIGLQKNIGSIEVGNQADLVVLNAPNYNYIPYKFGSASLINTVIKNGRIVAANNPALVTTRECL
ncbi:MAG: imidazolonepropionase [Candidatus Heimdallarchaeota archaeon]|nr:MAG: imidazolonepropionase [Candidatus Heimdallarchaeota archaeon]